MHYVCGKSVIFGSFYKKKYNISFIKLLTSESFHKLMSLNEFFMQERKGN